MWADNETSEDLLGFRVHADLLLDVIKDETVLPVTIGVFGDWGSGKSSILKMIHEELAGDDEDDLKDDTLVLYFNGWVFEGYDDAKAALLECILEEFQNHKRLVPLVKEKVGKLLKSVNWMRVLGFSLKKIIIPGAAAYMTGGLSLIPQAIAEAKKLGTEGIAAKLTGEGAEKFFEGLFKEKEEENAVLVREFRKDFEDLIEASKIKKLVVIIDDLDRCTPERIIENLEAIKLFLNVGKTAFLIGADPRIVSHAIAHKYKTLAEERTINPNGRNRSIVLEYLEKLIQIPYNLPRLSDNEVETYMTLLFCKRELQTDFQKVVEVYKAHTEANRYGVFGFGNINQIISEEGKKKLAEGASIVASLSSIITDGLNGNPRQIKRFLNTFTLRKRLVGVAKIQDFRVEILAKLMVLEYSEPDLFKKIYEWQSTQQGISKELKEMETLLTQNKTDEIKSKYAEWANDKIILWLKVEPQLREVDLRDYYWISRDQLSRSISGSSLIPQHIRLLAKRMVEHASGKILEDLIRTEVIGKIAGDDLNSLLLLLARELVKTPEAIKIHRAFVELMKQKANSSVESYTQILGQIDHNKIPFSLEPDLTLASKANSRITALFSIIDETSSLGKAIKAKK